MNEQEARCRLDCWVGMACFAFIPLTLGVMLFLPFGPGWSLVIAAATIVIHRRLASQWVYAHASHRCLWCGGPPKDRTTVELAGTPALSVCAEEVDALDRFLRFCARNANPLRIGILVPVLGYFVLGGLAAFGIEPLSLELRRHLFRGPIAFSVVSVALFYRLASPERPDRFPFPIHNLALLGIRVTLWVFLAVGTWWLVLTGAGFLRAVGR